MSERLSAGQVEALRELGPLEGQRTPGGCNQCEAFQTVDPIRGGVWMVSVHHDPGCPVFAEIERRRS